VFVVVTTALTTLEIIQLLVQELWARQHVCLARQLLFIDSNLDTATGTKVFVVVTTALTTLAISYSFWFKNFGPGNLSV
jgi:hypothetical protein